MKIPVFYVVNKMDTPAKNSNHSYYQLGVDVLPVSAEHGIGVDDLLEEIYPYLSSTKQTPYAEDEMRFSIIGRPNVGKSTLVNSTYW